MCCLLLCGWCYLCPRVKLKGVMEIMREKANTKRILVVDDDKEYTSQLASQLRKEGYKVECFGDPVKAISVFIRKPYDIVISEYQIKSMDSFQMLGIMRGIIPSLHFIVLTNCIDETVELQSIEFGVDQFINKQKSLGVIVKYINDVLSKDDSHRYGTPHKLISYDDGIIVDTRKREVYKGDQLVDVTKKEYELLILFLSNKGVALSRETIAERLWTTEIEDIDLRVIDGHINRLRAKLDLFCINAVRGYGYKWCEHDIV